MNNNATVYGATAKILAGNLGTRVFELYRGVSPAPSELFHRVVLPVEIALVAPVGEGYVGNKFPLRPDTNVYAAKRRENGKEADYTLGAFVEILQTTKANNLLAISLGQPTGSDVLTNPYGSPYNTADLPAELHHVRFVRVVAKNVFSKSTHAEKAMLMSAWQQAPVHTR